MHTIRTLVLALAAALLACGGPAAEPSTPKPAPPAATRALFDFHVGPWVGLHQRLWAETGPRPPVPDEPMPAEDQAAWDRATAFYAARWKDRGPMSLIFDDELNDLNRALAAHESEADLAKATSIKPDVRAALEGAAGAYRRNRWPADRAVAVAFRDRLAAAVGAHGAAIASAIERAYETPWPSTPIRVDVARFAGAHGAYTVTGPPLHTTIASTDPRHGGDLALEIVFHEASHGFMTKLEALIEASCKTHKKPVPKNLWHVALFWTTGEIVRRELGGSFVPYAYHHGLYKNIDDWKAGEAVVAKHMPAHLDGKRTLAEVVDAIVDEHP